jgi:hypothetical protein
MQERRAKAEADVQVRAQCRKGYRGGLFGVGGGFVMIAVSPATRAGANRRLTPRPWSEWVKRKAGSRKGCKETVVEMLACSASAHGSATGEQCSKGRIS